MPQLRATKRSLSIFLAVLMLAAGALSSTVVPRAQAATVDTSAYYQLVARHSGKALDVSGASTADGAQIVQWSGSANAANQQWQFVDSGGGYYRLKARHSGKVLDVSARSTANGAQIVQWADNNATNQQFRLADSDSGYLRLINRNSGKALDVWEASSADGALVSQYTDTGATNQQWQLVKVGTSSPTPGSTATPVRTPTPGPVTPTPVRNITIPNTLGTHDPSRLINEGGSYYFYSTGRGIPVWYTTNGSTWQRGPAVFPNGLPAWTETVVPANDGYDVWAPDIIYNPNSGLFHLYYSVANWDDSSRWAIGLATSPTLNPNSPNYKWTDRGVVVKHGPGDTHRAIDPAPFFDAGGNLWLVWGSGYPVSGWPPAIFVTPLDKISGLPTSTALTTVQSGHIEAAYIHYRDGYYYLFWNSGGCCNGASSTYKIHMARSRNVAGPYVGKTGAAGSNSIFRQSSGSIHGPGHIGILSQSGTDSYTFHYYPDTGNSVLGLGTITWGTDGWPAP